MAVGGRLLHVFYEAPAYYLASPIKVLYFWEGGFVFFGGLLLALLAGWIWCERYDQNFWRWGDFFAPIFAFCYGVGRIACYINGCCYGRACDLPWAVEHSRHAEWGMSAIARHPTQLYAAGFELLTMFLVLRIEKSARPLGQVFTIWLGLHGAGRLLMEAFRDDPRGASPFGLSPATWLSLALITISCLCFILRRKPLPN